ncbi:hypothetical protein QTL96_05160 [Rhizobium sp. S163]|nr:hypothetical protein [Rhizobium sp. S163]
MDVAPAVIKHPCETTDKDISLLIFEHKAFANVDRKHINAWVCSMEARERGAVINAVVGLEGKPQTTVSPCLETALST